MLPCPYGTDLEGDALQKAAQLEYASEAHAPLADAAPFEMAESFAATAGGNPVVNLRRHNYAIVEDVPGNDALSMFVENHSAYAGHKQRTYETEAAECIFPPGERARTRQRPRRQAPPPSEDEKVAWRASFDESVAQYARVKSRVHDDQITPGGDHPSVAARKPFGGARPFAALRTRSVDATTLGYVDRFKQFRNRQYKISRVDAVPGAAKCGSEPFDQKFSVESCAFAKGQREQLKLRGQTSDLCRASIFGY
mmetsp:Transcript_23840/g.73587  ORF Transcript_23840/g.73587 Transcript_23840/m.73587 type:complete len:253 (-) Transcript_23840:112-870(-)